jgi:hypothetical protein
LEYPFEDILEAHSEKPGREQWRYCRIGADNYLKLPADPQPVGGAMTGHPA